MLIDLAQWTHALLQLKTAGIVLFLAIRGKPTALRTD